MLLMRHTGLCVVLAADQILNLWAEKKKQQIDGSA